MWLKSSSIPIFEYTSQKLVIIEIINKLEGCMLMTHHIVLEKRTNTFATVSIALAILGFVLSLIPILGWFLLPVWILAIIFGVVGLFKQYKRGMAIAGIAIGAFTFFYKIVIIQALFG